MTFFSIVGIIATALIGLLVLCVLYDIVRQMMHSHSEVMEVLRRWEKGKTIPFKVSNRADTYSISGSVGGKYTSEYSKVRLYFKFMWYCFKNFVLGLD